MRMTIMVVVETRWWSSTTCVLLGCARKDTWLADDTFVRLLHQTNHIRLIHISVQLLLRELG